MVSNYWEPYLASNLVNKYQVSAIGKLVSKRLKKKVCQRVYVFERNFPNVKDSVGDEKAFPLPPS